MQKKPVIGHWMSAGLSVLTMATWAVVTFLLLAAFVRPGLVPAGRESLALMFATVTSMAQTVLDFWLNVFKHKDNTDGEEKHNP